MYDLALGKDSHMYAPDGLWVVNTLVSEVPASALVTQGPREVDEVWRARVDSIRYRRFRFDWQSAQRQITHVSSQLQQSPEWVMVGRSSEFGEVATASPVSEVTTPEGAGSLSPDREASPWADELA